MMVRIGLLVMVGMWLFSTISTPAMPMKHIPVSISYNVDKSYNNGIIDIDKRIRQWQREHSTVSTLSHKKHRAVTMVVTAYTACDTGMNCNGITADGKHAIPWHTVAASKRWPFGTVFETKSGTRWVVDDRGGAIGNGRLDLYVGKHDRGTALKWGIRTMTLEVVKVVGKH